MNTRLGGSRRALLMLRDIRFLLEIPPKHNYNRYAVTQRDHSV